MVLRIAIFALIALGIGGFGTIAWVALNPPAVETAAAAAPGAEGVAAPQAQPLPSPKILVASRSLRAGTLLKPDDLDAVDVSVANAAMGSAAGALSDTPAMRAGLKGAMVRHSMADRAPLLPADVVRPGDFGFLAAVLAPGMRGVTIGVDAVSGSAGLIWPGDRVDLILTQDLDAQAQSPGRRVVGETILVDLRVIAIDQQLAQGVNPGGIDNALARTATLEVTPRQVETVTVASRLGRLSIVVRAAETQPIDGVVVTTAPMAPAPAVAPPVVFAGASAAARASGGDPQARPVAAPAGDRVRATTWGSDVSPALAAPAPSGTTLKVFTGSADGKEFKF